jgi:hypothetical protein
LAKTQGLIGVVLYGVGGRTNSNFANESMVVQKRIRIADILTLKSEQHSIQWARVSDQPKPSGHKATAIAPAATMGLQVWV